MKKTKKKPSFDCDVNGGIMVTCALRYSLGRMTYVPGAVQDWIKTYWDSLDSNTKCVIIRDVFEYLYDEFRSSGKYEVPFGGYDVREWEKFAIDRYWKLDYNERKYIDQELKNIATVLDSGISKDSKWLSTWMIPKLYEYQNEL